MPGHTRAFAAPIKGLSMPGVSSSPTTSDDGVVRSVAINRTQRSALAVTPKQQNQAAQVVAPAPSSPTVAPPDTAQEGAAVRAASEAPPPDLPLYQVYQVQDGDNVQSIADRFGVRSDYIVANNAEIKNHDFLALGQSIIVPAGNGILHEIRYGETLSDIAARYDVTQNDITGFRLNHITAADDIKERELVFVPNGQLPQAVSDTSEASSTNTPAGSSDASTPTPDSGSGGGTGGDGSSGGGSSDGSSDSGNVVRSGPSSGHGLIWPVVGPISSYYGPSHPLGIDIDGYNLAGAAVGAATSGTVTFAGGNSCCSYGLYVVVVSPDGIETLYAHLSSISVRQGESVSQGEGLGIIGSTGYSTGRHLHFEVIDNGTRVNPLSYLP